MLLVIKIENVFFYWDNESFAFLVAFFLFKRGKMVMPKYHKKTLKLFLHTKDNFERKIDFTWNSKFLRKKKSSVWLIYWKKTKQKKDNANTRKVSDREEKQLL